MSSLQPEASAPHSQNSEPVSACNGLTVMFDGSCPLCRREISVYQGTSPLEPVQWLDVSSASAQLKPDEQTRYMARFHVQLPDGSHLSGAAAFVALWQRLPGWRWLAKVCKLPGIIPALEWLYTQFLRIRPRIQRWAR
jgi:3-demethoxyubiquinol 3-hydroxylase